MAADWLTERFGPILAADRPLTVIPVIITILRTYLTKPIV